MKTLLYYLGAILLLLLFELILGVIAMAISYVICNFFNLGTGFSNLLALPAGSLRLL